MTNTNEQRILRAPLKLDKKWTDLIYGNGEGLVGDKPSVIEPLAVFIHMSDLHICDSASPARLEFLDRLADPGHPLSQLIPYVGTYRAQEFLTVHVLEAMVESINQIKFGPLTSASVDAVVITGDVIDNAQLNELRWYKDILDGGDVHPKSGHDEHSESFHSSRPEIYDIHYYHPDGPPSGYKSDRPHELDDFPHFQGLLAASEKSFKARGLRHPWFAVHGNHDALLQGTAAPTPELNMLVTGERKLSALRSLDQLPVLFEGFGEVGPATYPGFESIETVNVTADPRRKLVDISDWIDIHTECEHDHGLVASTKDTAYWFRDIGDQVRLIGLDTVNCYGGWQGCIHRQQFEWLRDVLEKSHDKYVVISSHHPLENLFNGYVPDGVPHPALEVEIRELLALFPQVILWFSGHVHDHKITESKNRDGRHAFWEIRTCSHIDWPQQARIIEIMKSENNHIVIGTIAIDHAGPVSFNGTNSELRDPIALAGFSRSLAANDWQRQREGPHSFESLEGGPADRNIWLWAPDPLSNR